MLSETASGAELTKERIAEIRTAFNGVASAELYPKRENSAA